ncbi:MAG: hypothetical protein U0361_15725 [Nitrospiraceae bacterium]
MKNFFVGHHVDTPVGFLHGRKSRLPAGRIADPDGGGDRLRFCRDMASTIGAAPAAWNPIICGSRVIWLADRYSRYPFQ